MGNWKEPIEFNDFLYPCSSDDSHIRSSLFDTLPAQVECEPPLALFHPTIAISLDLELVAAFPSHPWNRKKDLKCGAVITWKRQSCITVLRFLKQAHADLNLFHVGNHHRTEGAADVHVLRNGPGWACAGIPAHTLNLFIVWSHLLRNIHMISKHDITMWQAGKRQGISHGKPCMIAEFL